MIHRLFSYSCFCLKTDISLVFVFKPLKLFFASSCTNFYVPTSVWTEGFKQLHRNYLVRFRSYMLKIPTTLFLWYPYIRTYILLCSDKELSRLQEHEFLSFRKKCESTSDKTQTAFNTFTDMYSSHIKWISGFILCTL